MANVKTQQGHNPFRAERRQEGVGQTIGERRQAQQLQRARTAPAPVKKQPLDQFSTNGKKPRGVENFAAQATYNAGRKFTSKTVPHKRPLHERIENGTAPSNAGVQGDRPSDSKLLRFLDWIEENEFAHNSARLKKAYKQQAVKQAQQVGSAVRGAAPSQRAQRGYPAGTPTHSAPRNGRTTRS